MRSDHDYFNSSEQHEHDYVARLYDSKDRPNVRKLLKDSCEIGTISYSTHKEVYDLIEKTLNITRVN